jgi:apolipoprotein N-acyltransferase
MSFLAAIATGLLLWACYPPAGVGPLVWIALAPLLAALWPKDAETANTTPRPAWWRPTRAGGAFLHGYLAGATFFLLNLNWLHHVTAPGMVMLALYLAIYPALWALFVATVARPRHWHSSRSVARATLLAGAAWTGLEWLRGIALTGFGWNGLGVALGMGDTDRHLRQWAEWIGVTGLSFLPAAHAAFWIGVWRLAPTPTSRRARRATRFAQALLLVFAIRGLLSLVGAHRSRSLATAIENAPPLTVALVQPNIPQEAKNLYESFESIALTLTRLTQQAFASEPKPDIVVWPESSLPAPFSDPAVQFVLREGRDLGAFTHILGIDDQGFDAYFNSIAVFREDPLQATLHHKVHLVPFGEYLPARGLFGRFDYIREQLPGDFVPGTSTEPLPLPLGPSSPPGLRLIPLVCFEDTLGRVARRFARPEPQIIVNVTNDAWFRDSAGADQHLANAVFRSIELRRPMIRAANTGVTAVIDPLGQITHRLPRLQEGQLKATVPFPSLAEKTLYARIGDFFSISLLACSLLATGQYVRTRRPAANP